MPYIGKAPVGGGFNKLSFPSASATATYALTLGGAAYFPETANHLIVSLNGIIQAPQDSFTISGSNLVFAEALTTSDTIDFIVALGDVFDVGSVSDGTITASKVSSNLIRNGIRINTGTLSTNTTIAASERGVIGGSLTVDNGVTLTINGELTIV
jgi:hypothetical protein